MASNCNPRTNEILEGRGYIEKQNNIIGYTKRKIIDIKVPKLDTKLTTAHVPIRDT